MNLTLPFFIINVYKLLNLIYNTFVMNTLNSFTIRHPYPHEEGQTIFVREKAWLSAYSNIFSEQEIKQFFQDKKNNPNYRKNNLEKITNINYFAGCLNNQLVAIMQLKLEPDAEGKGELICFYCLPEYQRKGVGTKLFNFAKNQFILAGLKSFKVEILKENKIGTSFYIKQGGKLISSRNKLYLGKDLTFVTFEFVL